MKQDREIWQKEYIVIFKRNDHLYVNLLIIILFTKINKYVIKVIYSGEEISRVIVRVRRVKLDLSSGSIINIYVKSGTWKQSVLLNLDLFTIVWDIFFWPHFSLTIKRYIFVTVNTAFQWESCTVVNFQTSYESDQVHR